MRKTSEAQLRAVAKYRQHLARLEIKLKPEQKEELQRRAFEEGISVTKYILRALNMEE